MLVEDSLRGVEVVRELAGPIVDVGSGGGAPGIPLAAALPSAHAAELGLGLATLAILVLWPRLRTRVPAPHRAW